MKKLILITLLALALFPSCNRKMEKPFIIIDKGYYQNMAEDKVYFEYVYQESGPEGCTITFTDTVSYEIGDTLAK